MAHSVVQSDVAQSTGTTVNVTGLSSVTATNHLICVGTCDYSAIGADKFSTSQTDTFTAVVACADADAAQIAWVKSAVGGSTTVTMTSANSYVMLSVVEVSGLDTTATPQSNENGSISGGPDISCGSITTTSAGFTIAGTSFGTNTTVTEEGTWTLLQEDEAWSYAGGGHAYKSTTAGTFTHTWTMGTSTNFNAVIASFDDAAGGPAATPKFLTLLGVG